MSSQDAAAKTAATMNTAAHATNVAGSLALQAGNYHRAVKNGTPHDLGEARSLVASAQALVDAIEGNYPPITTHDRKGADGR